MDCICVRMMEKIGFSVPAVRVAITFSLTRSGFLYLYSDTDSVKKR